VFYKGAQERLDAGSIGLVQRTSGAEKFYIFNCEERILTIMTLMMTTDDDYDNVFLTNVDDDGLMMMMMLLPQWLVHD